MRGKGMSRDQSQTTSWAGKSKRTLKPCRGKGKLDGVVLIDIDDDDYGELILIDVPESMQQKFRGPRVFGKDRNFPFPPVISVDDDDEEDTDFSASDDTSRNRGSVNTNLNQGRNRYGLGPDSESCSYESDSSDCEVLDGSINELREQWSKASQKRKSRTDDQTKASTSSHKHPNVGVECKTDQPIDSEKFPFNSSTPSPASHVGPVFQRKPQTAAIPFNGSGHMNPSPSSPKSDVLAVQEDIINGREKLKETDEYKRAMEEEWASTQRQLQIQSEEAQRLRKRKKAERMRLLEMERRQKLRLEEVRETEKKDEEYNNQKEKLRDEVRKNLKRLETTCTDLASLLRNLGIPVGGPSSAEVHAAYKRASLKFHPDRTARMDIRQQVEYEEKFKLISRMKEKFL